ncbi:MAG: hypothetical protein R3B13_04000 [Polyangiaceae bacterium]
MADSIADPLVASAQASESDEAPASGGEYEFKHPENLVIGSCANRARIFGILCAISGVVHLFAVGLSLAGVVDAGGIVYLLPSAAFNIVLGVLLFRVSTTLTKVVMTAGNDVTLMMSALTHLSKAFVVQIVLTAVVLVAITASMVALVLAARMG